MDAEVGAVVANKRPEQAGSGVRLGTGVEAHIAERERQLRAEQGSGAVAGD